MTNAIGQMGRGVVVTHAGSISVVVPCFNSHALLDRTLRSLIEQSLRPDEIIVVDDGSSDPDTIVFLDALDGSIRLVRQENRGLPGARNSGIRAATGTFILPLDSDDWLSRDAIEKLRDALAAHPEAAFAFADMMMEGELEGVLAKNFNYFEQLFFNQLPYCLMYRRTAWAELGGYDENFRKGYEDWDFNIRLSGRGEGIRVPQPLFNYRIAAGGMLLAVSNRHHVELWNAIRAKSPHLYRFGALVPLWRVWRRRPSTYPLWAYFVWAMLVEILPLSASNWMFTTMRKFSQSRRTGKPGALKIATSG